MMLIRLPLYVFWLLAQSVSLAISQIWANKARAILTTVGIVISVASVTTVVAALSGLKANILSEFEAFGTNKIYISPQTPKEGPLHQLPWYRIRFTPEQFEGLTRNCPSVGPYTMITSYDGPVRYRNEIEENVQVLAVGRAWHEIENRTIDVGRSFGVLDEEQARPVCLVTQELRDKLGLNRDCCGESLLIGNRLFTVIGVVAKANDMGGPQGPQTPASQVIVPFTTVWKERPNWLYVIATSKSAAVSKEAVAELRFYLRRVRDLKPGDPDTFRLDVMEQYLTQFNTVAMMITAIAAGIVGISLVVGGVGIMNIMLVSVSERTREIGLRKAVGAGPSAIMLQFLVEAVVLCLVGGLLGLVAGQLFTSAIAAVPQTHLEKAQIPLWAVALSFGFSAAVGLFFGMLPAIKAARLDPIEALRHV
jgi:putative ABC transport system permease protein